MSYSNPLSTARSLVLLQLLSRILTFALNQTLLRLASPAVFGTAAIQFDLVCSTILFLSREGIRNALLRQTDRSGKKGDGEQSQIHKLSIIPLRLGLLISSLVTGVYIWSSSLATTSQDGFWISLALYVLSALIELFIEPCYIQVHRSTPPKLNVRMQAEGGMVIVKAFVTFVSLLVLGEQGALLSFAMGQVTGASWLAARYLQVFKWDIKKLLLSQNVDDESVFDSQTFSLALANTGQGVIKHVLTESDRLAVARFSPLDGQGGYAVAMNYGSLVARIVFQPLEESLLLYYSSSLSYSTTVDLFSMTVRLALYFASIIRAFVPPLFPALIPFLLPKQYQNTAAPSILKLYLTSYIPLLCLNGVSESFHTASANPNEVKLQAKWMVISSGVFAATLATLASTGPIYISKNNGPYNAAILGREESLVLASCAAMLVRIFYAIRHGKMFFVMRKPSLRWLSLIPSIKILLWMGIVKLILSLLANTGRWQRGWKQWAELMGIGGTLGMFTLGWM
nr:oligosaccharidyl-lipid flippase [Cryptococcus depauperatus CBS 7855]